jgi:hypothetical protein
VKIFVAAPFTQWLQQGGGSVPDTYRVWLEELHEALRAGGHDVISAHEREAWGDDLEPASSALRADLESILSCDVLVAELGNPPSPGVQMELGVALVAGKRIVVLAQVGAPIPYLVTGLESVGDAKVLYYEDPQTVLGAVSKLLSRRTRASRPRSPDNGGAKSVSASSPRRRRPTRST